MNSTLITVRFVLNLQSLPDVTMSPDMSKFVMKRLSLHFSEDGKRRTPVYHVIRSQAIPYKKIKSTKTGKVSLTFNWKDCGAWIGLNGTKAK